MIEVKPIPDKALVRVWNDSKNCVAYECFYDAVNECTFTISGNRKGLSYNYYEIIDPEPEWAKEANKLLKD